MRSVFEISTCRRVQEALEQRKKRDCDAVLAKASHSSLENSGVRMVLHICPSLTQGGRTFIPPASTSQRIQKTLEEE